jgi:hypothetical protein
MSIKGHFGIEEVITAVGELFLKGGKHVIFFLHSKHDHDNSDTHLRLWTGSNP